MASAEVKFVGQKVSKVRWTPSGHLNQSNTFVSGGWDDQVNKLSLWSAAEAVDSGGWSSGASDVPPEPQLITDIEHDGSVTDIKYVDSDRILTSSSSGSVTLYKYDTHAKHLVPAHSWSNLHHHDNSTTCSCTCLATTANLPDFISAGEDGRMVVLRMDHVNPVRNLGSADCTTISGVTFIKSYEVATVNFIGQLKIWDLRQKGEKPVRVMLLSGDRVPLMCIDKHPTQPHLIATGGQDGVLGLWDMRQERYPVTLLQAHSAEVWEVKFHEPNPDHLFTCSQDGSVWHWDGSSMKTISMDISKLLNPSLQISQNGLSDGSSHNVTTPWLSADAGKHKIETFSLLPYNRFPVNSVDINARNLVCGTDGEAVYVIKNLDLG